MATYIALVNFTDHGARHIRQTTERAKSLVKAAANLGIKIRDIYWTLGPYDAIFVAEAENDESITAFALGTASLGNVRTQTLRAFSADEMSRILDKIPPGEVTTTK